MNILSQKWANISYRKQRLLWIYNRAEWKTQKLEFSKSSSRFRTASQHWFQNNWRNHYRMNILLLNQENSFYRERKLQHSSISSNFWLKGLFTIFLFSVRTHILNSNGVWYSWFWSEGPKNALNPKFLGFYFVPRDLDSRRHMGPRLAAPRTSTSGAGDLDSRRQGTFPSRQFSFTWQWFN